MQVPKGYVLIKEEDFNKLLAIVEEAKIALAKIPILEARIKELESQLNKNSGNSHKPPSTDGFKRNQSLRTSSNKKSGAQPGHKGSTLKMVSQPDYIDNIIPEACNHCGGQLTGKTESIEVRQVIDIPIQKSEIVEYQSHCRRCRNCGQISKGKFPIEAQNSIQYGNRVKSFISYLSCYQMIPQGRIKELMRNVYGLNLSGGVIFNSILKSAESLQLNRQAIAGIIKNSWVVGFDETGIYVDKKLKWMHTASTPECTFLTLHEKRGSLAMDDIGILEGFQGIAMHDRWASYFKYTDCNHALCNAHIIRDLKSVYEDWNYSWANEMIELLLEAKKISEKPRPPSGQTIEDFEKRYIQIVKTGLKICESEGSHIGRKARRGRTKQSKAKNLLDDLKTYKDAFLAFLYDPNIPFDNNGSERDIRMAKVKMKVSGGFRSLLGAEAFVTIRGYVNTVIKNKKDVLTELVNALNGNAYLPAVG